MILGHWSKKKTPKASGNNGGENIEETERNKGESKTERAGSLDPGDTRDFLTSSLTESRLSPERACD